ncbi:MAG: hypothetical protein LC778_19790 [Acidobacteria bacterium]|nr:hypothetical protein [Acidobacteriota bacterium]
MTREKKTSDNPTFLKEEKLLSSNKENTRTRSGKKAKTPAVIPPQIAIFREITGRYPQKECWDLVVKTIGQATVEELRPYWTAWRSKDFRPTNLAWLTEWFAKRQIPSISGSVKGKPEANDPTRIQSNYEKFMKLTEKKK